MEADRDVIKVDVNLTPEDLYVFQKHLLKKGFKPIVVIGAAVMLLMFLASIITSELILVAKIMELMLLLGVLGILFFSIPRMLMRSSKNAFRDNKLASQTQRFTISQEYIQVESNTGFSKIKWTDLYKTEEIKENFLLYISKQQAYIISKKYFESDEKQADLMRRFMLQAPVPSKEKKSGKSMLWRLMIYVGIFILVLIFVTYFNS